MHPIIETILRTFSERGSETYGIEAVTQQQHALQSALWAIRSGASNELVIAALLHDLGHILGREELPENCEENLDDHHENRVYQFLKEHFGSAVAEPVRLHVAAKRYLCTVDRSYEKKLSPTSWKSFLDQGGYMSPDEMTAFEKQPSFREALELRRWDDLAKDPDEELPPIEDFVPLLNRLLRTAA